MTTDRVEIMDIPFINTNKQNFLEQFVYTDINNENKKFIVTANPEIVMMAKENQSYKDAVLKADYIVPDGAGIVMASKMLKQPIEERIPGFDLMVDLIAHAEEERLSCYFLGAGEKVIEEFIRKIKVKHPKLNIAGYHHGYFDLDDQSIVNDIKRAEPDLVFVALGLPRQEQWIAKNHQKFKKGIFMGVGGSFDVIAGKVKRAPDVWIKFNLEWLYRLLKQPFRWRRILKVFEFMFRILLRRY